jgi:glycerol-3-phosphate acyltransferase PlsX
MAAIGPSAKGDVVMLDLGLNVVYDARNLVEFALMGEIFARVVLGLPAPTFGLLNIGSEEGKGDEILRSAAATLRESPLAKQFHGFVEGHDIAGGTVDVVVTDGFTGNVALKTGEGALKLVGDLLKRVFTSGPFARAGYVLARGGLKRLREWLDPRRYNGAVLLGLNGVVVKSHGGADAEGFAHAVDVAIDMISHDFNRKISDGLAAMDQSILASGTADV